MRTIYIIKLVIGLETRKISWFKRCSKSKILQVHNKNLYKRQL